MVRSFPVWPLPLEAMLGAYKVWEEEAEVFTFPFPSVVANVIFPAVSVLVFIVKDQVPAEHVVEPETVFVPSDARTFTVEPFVVQVPVTVWKPTLILVKALS